MRIQIGRVVRGNNLTIKDQGISSKHLSINFESEPVGCWTISDLGSSNGTLLNRFKLDPFTPRQLSGGDVIEMGELTLIKVKFEEASVNQEVSKVRGNPHRRRGGKLAVVDANNDLELGKGEDNQNAKGQSRRCKGVSKTCEVSESKELTEEQMVSVRRVTRRTLKKENGVEGEREKMAKLLQKSRLRGNGNKKGKLDENEDVEEMENVGKIEAKDGENSSSRRLGSVKEENVSGVWTNLGVNELGGLEGKGGQRESLRRITRSMRKAESSRNLGGNRLQTSERTERVLPIEAKGGKNVISLKEENLKNLLENGGTGIKKARKGTRGKRNLGAEMLPENVEDAEKEREKVKEKLNSRREEIKEVQYGLPVNGMLEKVDSGAVDGLVEKENLGIEGCEGLESMSTVKDDDVVDLEKMTLGGWFDYLEVHLPKQIIDATEEMILGMRLKAGKFHEFMLQKKNSKWKVEEPTYKLEK